MNYKEEVLELFKNSNDEMLSYKHIVDNINIPQPTLRIFCYYGILEPTAKLCPITFTNMYKLSKYYKRLVTLKKIENE